MADTTRNDKEPPWVHNFSPDAWTKAPQHEIVVIVHGTFANPTYNSDPSSDYWWSPSGSFATALDAALKRHGSAARCHLPFELRLRALDEDRPDWLGWSGGNSEVERRQGAYELATYLRALQVDDTIRTIHIIAHSHGGNVVRRALRYMNRPAYKLGRVICLGTPFLHFNDSAAWRRWMSRVHWPMLIVLAATFAGLYLSADWLNKTADLVALYITCFLFAMMGSLWRYARSSEASSVDVPAIALEFEHDEAIQLLRACAAFTAAPHMRLRDVLGGAVPRRPRAERPRSALRPDCWFGRATAALGTTWRGALNTVAWLSDLWNRPICRAAERVTGWAYRVPLLGAVTGSLCTLLLIMLFRPYRPAVRAFLTSRLPRVRELFFHWRDEDLQRMRKEYTPKADDILIRPYHQRLAAIEGDDAGASRLSSLLQTMTNVWKNIPLHPEQLQILVMAAPVLVYWLFFYPLDKLAGLLPWLSAVGTRFFILVGMRAAAGSAPGVDMLGAAFNARRTGEMPAGVEKVTIPAAIEKDLEQRLDTAMRVNLTPLRHALDPARNAMLLDAVKTAFTEPMLLHAQYYQEERVVDFVAGVIAGKVEPGRWETLIELNTEPATPSSPATESSSSS